MVKLQDVKTLFLKIHFLCNFWFPFCFLLSKTSWEWTVQCGFRIIILLLRKEIIYQMLQAFKKRDWNQAIFWDFCSHALAVYYFPMENIILCVQILFRDGSCVSCTPGVTVSGSRRFGSARIIRQNHSAQILLQTKYIKRWIRSPLRENTEGLWKSAVIIGILRIRMRLDSCWLRQAV